MVKCILKLVNLQEFEAVLNETVTLDTSQFSSSSDSSLHELSQGVDEANELCKQFQINFVSY